MRARVLVAALGAVTLATLALGRAPASRPEPPRGTRAPEAPAPAPSTAPPPVDPARIRDVFRFADETAPAAYGEPEPASREAEASAAPLPSGPRLVGLVRRAGRIVAALAADGEVVLAGPGEVAAGVTVLSVGEEGVRIRRADGTEETLELE